VIARSTVTLREMHHRTLSQPARAILPPIPTLVDLAKLGQTLRMLQNLLSQLLHGLHRSIVG